MQIKIRRTEKAFVTRFAPSPTGYLHLGHLTSMCFVYGIARAVGATVILRVEDHDRGRSRTKFEDALVEDLKWAGFSFDSWPDKRPHNLRQSDRLTRYDEIRDELIRKNLAYRCKCTRAEIRGLSQELANSPDGEELAYPGTCRNLDLSKLADGFGLRLRVPDRTFAFIDGIHGSVLQNPSQQCGDYLIQDRAQNFTYNFAVSVDDMDQQVNLIIRGDDLLHATARQIFTAELLGRTDSIQTIHHPLICDDSGKKLGKRFFSEALAKQRAEGANAMDLIGQAAFLAGLTDKFAPLSADELSSLFQIILD